MKEHLPVDQMILNFLMNDWPHFQLSFGKLQGEFTAEKWLLRSLVIGLVGELIFLLTKI